MPWCPNCRDEYRPGIIVCPNCDVALVGEQPPQPPHLAGWRIEPNSARYLVGIMNFPASFRLGLRLARQAAGLMFRNWKLLLVVLALAVIYWGGTFYLMRNPNYSWRWQEQQLPGTSAHHLSFSSINAQGLAHLTQSYAQPLGSTTSFLGPWALLLTKPDYSGSAHKELSFEGGFGILLWLLGILIFVLILGHIKAVVTGTKRESHWSYLDHHYVPILLLQLIVMLVIDNLVAPELFRFGVISQYNPFLPLSWLVLILAPYAIVGLDLGWWKGFKASLYILWKYLVAMAALWLIYIVASVIIMQIAAWELDLTTPHYDFNLLGLFYDIRRPPLSAALLGAMLGLWLAFCFMLLVLKDRQQMIEQTNTGNTGGQEPD
jgi:hypothetical protein